MRYYRWKPTEATDLKKDRFPIHTLIKIGIRQIWTWKFKVYILISNKILFKGLEIKKITT